MAEILRKAISQGVVDEDKRKIYLVIFDPTIIDLEGDAITQDAIEEAADDFMEFYGTVGWDHETQAHAVVTQSFVAPRDFTYDGSIEKVNKGSWVVVFRIKSDELWNEIKANGVKGVSPGGKIIDWVKVAA